MEKARKEHEPLWIKCHFKNNDPWGSSKGNVKKKIEEKKNNYSSIKWK